MSSQLRKASTTALHPPPPHVSSREMKTRDVLELSYVEIIARFQFAIDRIHTCGSGTVTVFHCDHHVSLRRKLAAELTEGGQRISYEGKRVWGLKSIHKPVCLAGPTQSMREYDEWPLLHAFWRRLQWCSGVHGDLYLGGGEENEKRMHHSLTGTCKHPGKRV